MSFKTSFKHLLKWEGGFGNNIHDAGGPTNLGVTEKEYDMYRDKKNLPRQDVRHISEGEAEEIYKTDYWDKTRCDDLNEGLANCLFDSDVNSGNRRGVTWLQEAINNVSGGGLVTVDGRPGPKTVAAANSLAVHQLIDEMLRRRLAFMHIARNSKTGEPLWPVFGRGWQKRIDGVRAESHELAGIEAPQTSLLLSHNEKEKIMSELAPILELAKVVAPALVATLESTNPLFSVALNLISTELQTTSEALPATIATTSPAKLAAALKSAETELKNHASAMVSAPPAPSGISGDLSTSNIYVDEMASTAKYVLGVVSVALMVKMGMSVEMANGFVANIMPAVWTLLAGATATGMGWLLRRSIAGSNAATEHLVKKS